MKLATLTAGALALGLASTPAMAAEILHHDPGVGFNETFRGPGSAPFGRLTVDNAVTITHIGILANLNGDSNMQFLIFDAISGANLFTSAIKSFVDDGQSYKWSDALSFTFNPGTTYSVGVTSSNGASYRLDGLANEVGDFNFFTGNQNARGPFGSTTLDTGQNCCDVATAFRTAVGGAVPEPGTWLLMILGFGAIGASMRRTNKPKVSYDFA